MVWPFTPASHLHLNPIRQRVWEKKKKLANSVEVRNKKINTKIGQSGARKDTQRGLRCLPLGWCWLTALFLMLSRAVISSSSSSSDFNGNHSLSTKRRETKSLVDVSHLFTTVAPGSSARSSGAILAQSPPSGSLWFWPWKVVFVHSTIVSVNWSLNL